MLSTLLNKYWWGTTWGFTTLWTLLCNESGCTSILCTILGSMSERRGRGHRKLCLCSNKYYEKKKYFPKSLLVSIPKRTVSILPFSIPIDLVTFRVSLPLAAYSESPVPSLKVLVDRILHLRALTEGKHEQLMIYKCSTC